ncbi:hypothetical protein M427DRAFT_93669 [Gonapodya prolifera JEL478]|uniref:THIF-type NAD/FAD binding fold domain-containing protein n=1 Tax=Gonapodya prolifera (strain JEL478) TaxID=1344416 RepID=A0A139AXE0_GONPJ|nr:hypothetical protein M427DRAFT_93669 [Gonapodya prolifera JEL478]|eukprot:KXS21377.1 hypothetical protein M427DRAFT_93669 [Gonapodya prolifera JEL478]
MNLRSSSRKRVAKDVEASDTANASPYRGSRAKPSQAQSSKRAKNNTSSTDSKENGNGHTQINDDEAQLYDRQIRLWGLDAQTRMRNASVCIVNFGALSTEIIKNLVLAGIGALTVVDPENVAPKDLGAGFFFRQEDVGQNRAISARERILDLNPRVKVDAVTKPLSDLDDDFYTQFQFLVLTQADLDTMLRIDDICRAKKIKLFAAGIYGLTGYAFADLVEHVYTTANPAAKDDTSAPKDITRTIQYHSLAETLEKRWDNTTDKRARDTVRPKFYAVLALLTYQQRHNAPPSSSEADVDRLVAIKDELMKRANVNPSFVTLDLLRSLAATHSAELSPIAALAGGLLSQEILRAIGEKDPPMDNVLVIDGLEPQAGIAGY